MSEKQRWEVRVDDIYVVVRDNDEEYVGLNDVVVFRKRVVPNAEAEARALCDRLNGVVAK